MISAAIFGGDVGEAAARGAAWGASIGAVSGAARGSAEDSARKQRTAREQQSNIEREINRIRAELGEDAFSSLERLVDHKYDAALAYARSAQRSQNSEHALAGLWLEAIGYYDAGREREAGELIPALVAAEPTIASESDARAILVDLHEGLIEIREAFGVPS